MIKITRQQYLDAQAKVVEERGHDYVYPDAWRINASCQYVYDGKPGCIVGATLSKLDVPLSELHKWEGMPASALFQQLEREGVARFEQGTLELASRAQSVQDRTNTDAPKSWGKAHEASLDEAVNYQF